MSYYLWVFKLDLVHKALEFCALISCTWPTFWSHTCRCDIFVLRVPRPTYIYIKDFGIPPKTFWRFQEVIMKSCKVLKRWKSRKFIIIIIIYSRIQSTIIWDFWKLQSFTRSLNVFLGMRNWSTGESWSEIKVCDPPTWHSHMGVGTWSNTVSCLVLQSVAFIVFPICIVGDLRYRRGISFEIKFKMHLQFYY